MPFNGKPGDSIFIDDPGGGHRYVILTEPDSNNQVVIVNFTADKFGKDPAVIFGRHHRSKLFSKPTAVNYPSAYKIDVTKLESEAEKPNCKYGYCPADMLNRIILGAFQSNFTPTGIQTELEAQYPDIAKDYYKTHPNY
jgi:hypothetical protein